MFDWLYGPRFVTRGTAHLLTRNLTLNIENIFELADEIPRIVAASDLYRDDINWPELRDGVYSTRINAGFRLRNRELSEQDVQSLGIPERNQLTLAVEVVAWVPSDAPIVPEYVTRVGVDVRTASILVDDHQRGRSELISSNAASRTSLTSIRRLRCQNADPQYRCR